LEERHEANLALRYLEPLETLAGHRPVIFYDQLGCGRYDECTPGHLEEIHRRIGGSQLVIIEDASHLCFAEKPEEFNQVISAFLDRTAGARALA